MSREQELMDLVAEQADKLVDQQRRIVELEARLSEAQELARLGGWQAGTMGRGVDAVLAGRGV